MHSNTYKKNIARTEGFTLGELLIVVGIIGILVAVSIPIFTSQLKKARLATDQANVRSARAAAAAEYMSDGETGPVNYLYDGSRAIKLSNSSVSLSGKGYGKSDSFEGTGALRGIPKNNYIEVTVNESTQSSDDPIQAVWISSAGASGLATGNYVFTGALTKDSIAKQIEEMGVEAKDITTFKAAEGSTINETAKKDPATQNQIKNGVLVDLFQNLPKLKHIDLSNAKLQAGNINLFRDLPSSVESITLPEATGGYDIRGVWYYADGTQLMRANANQSGADSAQDSRVQAKDSGVTIYRTREAAMAAS